jgi:hypothetical protein
MWMNYLSSFITFGVFAAAVGFLFEVKLSWAIVFLLLWLLRLHVRRLSRIALFASVESRANVEIKLTINLEEVLRHKTVEDLFIKLPKEATGCENYRQFFEQLVSNYKRKAKSEQLIHSVSFVIRNGLLFKDDKIYHTDSIIDQVEIPYLSSNDDLSKGCSTDNELTIRLIVVNGELNLEVGQFNKETSPEVYKTGFFATYKTYVRLTSFPILLEGWLFGIPSRYLNLLWVASLYYKEKLKLISPESAKSDLRGKPNDWSVLQKDTRTYDYLVAMDLPLASHVSDSWYQKAYNNFEKRSLAYLRSEGFDYYVRGRDLEGPWSKGKSEYHNKYMSIYLVDRNTVLESMRKYWFTDYVEERP